MKKNKRLIISVLCVVLVLAMGIAGTLAWLSATTNTENNKFTLAKTSGTDAAMKAEVIETFDPSEALELLPGAAVEKVVTVKNTSEKAIDEWVAVKLTFEKVDPAEDLAAMAALNKVMELQITGETEGDGNVFGANWVRKNVGVLQAEEIFYYNTKLAKDATTGSLFDVVNILSLSTNEEIDEVYSWEGFNIKVEGAAVQDIVGTTLNADVKDALDGLFA